MDFVKQSYTWDGAALSQIKAGLQRFGQPFIKYLGGGAFKMQKANFKKRLRPQDHDASL